MLYCIYCLYFIEKENNLNFPKRSVKLFNLNGHQQVKSCLIKAKRVVMNDNSIKLMEYNYIVPCT